MKRSQAWIFVSHSTKDLAAVRRIRDHLEAEGTNPILFFLKCIDESDELDSLLRREIAARNFFVLCDSDSAKASKWVQQEVACVKELGHAKYCELDMHAEWSEQKATLDGLLAETRVFISSSFSELSRVEPFVHALIEADFSVFSPSADIAPGENWAEKIQNEIFAAADTGLMVCFLSDQSMTNPNIAAEIGAFIGRQGGKVSNLLLVAFDDVTSPPPFNLAQYQILKLSGSPQQQLGQFMSAIHQLKA